MWSVYFILRLLIDVFEEFAGRLLIVLIILTVVVGLLFGLVRTSYQVSIPVGCTLKVCVDVPKVNSTDTQEVCVNIPCAALVTSRAVTPASTSTPTPIATSTSTPTSIPTSTNTHTPIPTPTNTPTPTFTPTSTVTPTPTPIFYFDLPNGIPMAGNGCFVVALILLLIFGGSGYIIGRGDNTKLKNQIEGLKAEKDRLQQEKTDLKEKLKHMLDKLGE